MTRTEAKALASEAATLAGITKAVTQRGRWNPGGYQLEVYSLAGVTVWHGAECLERYKRGAYYAAVTAEAAQ